LISSSKHEYVGFTKAFLKSVASYGRTLGVDIAVIRSTTQALANVAVYTPPKNVQVASLIPDMSLPLTVLGGTKFNYRKVFNEGYEAMTGNAAVKNLLECE
jgi:hypothetical protein